MVPLLWTMESIKMEASKMDMTSVIRCLKDYELTLDLLLWQYQLRNEKLRLELNRVQSRFSTE